MKILLMVLVSVFSTLALANVAQNQADNRAIYQVLDIREERLPFLPIDKPITAQAHKKEVGALTCHRNVITRFNSGIENRETYNCELYPDGDNNQIYEALDVEVVVKKENSKHYSYTKSAGNLECIFLVNEFTANTSKVACSLLTKDEKAKRVAAKASVNAEAIYKSFFAAEATYPNSRIPVEGEVPTTITSYFSKGIAGLSCSKIVVEPIDADSEIETTTTYHCSLSEDYDAGKLFHALLTEGIYYPGTNMYSVGKTVGNLSCLGLFSSINEYECKLN